MYDIKPLEEEWLRYQTKKRRPLYFLFFLSVVSVLLMSFFFNKKNINFGFFEKYFTVSPNPSKETSLLSSQNIKKDLLLNKSLQRLEVLQVEPKENFVDMKPNNISNASNDILVDIPILDSENKNSINESEVHRKKVYLNIIETTSVSAYKDVENRFLQSHDIDDALFLAKSYYKKQNYQKSEHWALEANKLDANLEESFLIFVKSKIHLGEKNEAEAILNQYLKHKDSKDARVLLNQLENHE